MKIDGSSIIDIMSISATTLQSSIDSVILNITLMNPMHEPFV